MPVFTDSKAADIPFPCPACGSEIDAGPGIEYCDHVEFVWIWGDPDGWVFAKPDFPDEYINILKEKAGLLDDDGNEIEEAVIESFWAGLFEPFDDVSIAMPFNAKIIEDLAGSKGILLYEESSTYSGVVIGIKEPARAEKR